MNHDALDINLNELVVFTRVVQLSSFSRASDSLGVPRSTVSRRVASLEARVGARLLQRTTRTLSLTDVGRVYYEHCERIVAEIEEAQRSVTQLQAAPRGTLRVSVPLAFTAVGAILAEYMTLYPDVRIDLVCTDRRVDLIDERFDLAIRAGQLQDSTLIARRLGTVRRLMLATPEVVARIGSLAHPSELAEHPTIALASEGNTWRLRSGARAAEITTRPRLVVNDYEMLRAVVRAGFGVALLPKYLCAEELASGRLTCLLEEWTTEGVPIVALYPSTRHMSPKLIALLELLQRRLEFP